MQTLSDNQIKELAKKHVEFRRHLVVFIVINAALWVLWYLTGSQYPWPLWPLCFWGIGLIFHYLFDYRSSKMFSEEEEYKKLKSELEEEKHLTL